MPHHSDHLEMTNDTINWPNGASKGEIAEQFRDLDLWWEVQSNLGTSSQVVPSVWPDDQSHHSQRLGKGESFQNGHALFREVHSFTCLKVDMNILKILLFERKYFLLIKPSVFWGMNSWKFPGSGSDSVVELGSLNLVLSFFEMWDSNQRFLMLNFSKMFEMCVLGCKKKTMPFFWTWMNIKKPWIVYRIWKNWRQKPLH